MRKTKTVKINDREITAQELTVKQIDKIMSTLDDPEISNIDMLFPDRLPSIALSEGTGLSVDELADFTPSELEIMLNAVEELNPTFAGLMERLASVGRQAIDARKSEEQPAGSL